ncbi:glycosyltransferase family 39 protein [Cyanobium sp. Morenito 9A2]|uniref:ArnT family glycosyltransferase n=1 Tax=Cyanobium sp. Morenito 9A2 TaxID=2823718 RepID=UPI0020CE1C87|nr:glycosyltransferase family 39 protein [Cyanobium sp. Morenito 9A2]MCP9849351.1 glycosyltransferase family 39 protein [Cyanobium sp. Morenito 9A2]
MTPIPQAPSARLALLSAVGLLLLCWAAFFNQLGTLSLMDKTEALFVEVGREMVQRNDWITPHWNGEPFFDYPVWGYWMVALSFRVFGVSAWAARLPVALMASAVVVAGFALLWLLSEGEGTTNRWRRSWLGAALLALNPGWVGWGRTSVTDMFLSSAITLSLFGFFLAYSQEGRPGLRRWGYVAMPLFCGIAVLAKGPVGLVLPGAVIVVFLLCQGQLASVLRQMPMLPMALGFLAVASPWYLLAARVNGADFLGAFFGFSNLQRYTSVLYGHAGPWYFYLPWCLILLLPWSLFLPLAAVGLRYWRLDHWRQQSRSAQFAPFALIWFVVVLLFFSAASTKLAGYILPLVPAGALLVALFWQPLQAAQPHAALTLPMVDRWERFCGWLNVLLLAAMAVAAAIAPRWAASDPAYPGFAMALSGSGLPLILSAVLAAAALALVLLLVRPGPAQRLWLPDLAGFVGVLLLVVPGLTQLMERERQQPVREVAALAGQLIRPGEQLLVVGYKRYSVVFYSGHPVRFFDSAEGAEEQLREEINQGEPTPRSVLVVGEDRKLREFSLPPQRIERLASRGSHGLWRFRFDPQQAGGSWP